MCRLSVVALVALEPSGESCQVTAKRPQFTPLSFTRITFRMDTMMSILAQSSIALLVIIFIYILARGLPRRTSPSRQSSSSWRLGKYEEYFHILSSERQGTANTCYVMSLQSKEKFKQSLVFDALIRLA